MQILKNFLFNSKKNFKEKKTKKFFRFEKRKKRQDETFKILFQEEKNSKTFFSFMNIKFLASRSNEENPPIYP